MKRKVFRGVTGIAALLCLLFTQVAYAQETGDFNVSGGTTSFDGQVLTVSGGEVTVSTKNETSQTIKLTGGKLTLAGVQITVSSGDISPIEVDGEAEINLASNSENTLTSKVEEAPGIHVPPGSQVTFTGDGALTAENAMQAGMNSSSGIGGKKGTYSCGTIIFDLDGSVTAIGGSEATGIGPCGIFYGSPEVYGDILIKKGKIDATGGNDAAGIGVAMSWSTNGQVTVTIKGGTVKATGNGGWGLIIGIGSGYGNKTPVDIILLGGTVTANVGSGVSDNLNLLIVGPDVQIEGTIYEHKYDNGFIFSGSPKTATVKGNPVFPEGERITIDKDEKLTVPWGASLTNNGLIINNGTIDSKTQIYGDGAIIENKPNKWNGYIAYIGYDTNGGNGTITDAYHNEETINSFPSIDGLSKDGYTCLGWNTTKDATTALTSYDVVSGANTLYAVWEAVEMIMTDNAMNINGTVGTAFTEVDLSAKVSNNEDVLGATFTVKEGSSLPTDFRLSKEGLLSSPTPLTTFIEEAEVIVTVSPNNGAPAMELTLTFKVAKGTLIVTPAPDQTIYAGEYPAYTLPEYITGETPITGNLAIVGGVIKLGDVELTDKGRENYNTVELSAENIPITQKTTNASDAVVEIIPSGSGINQAGWYRNPVSLKAPGGFNIWVESAQALRNICLLTEDGIYTSYRLVQKFFNAEYTHDIDIKLDQTAPKLKDAPTVSFQKAVFTLADTLSGIASYSYQLDDAAPSEIKTVEGAPNEYEVEVMGAVGAHTITFTIWDVAGNMTISELVDFTLPLPTVTLPEVEGVTFNPLAGSHEVKLQDNFYFSLTLNEGYRENSKPVVTTHLGETIEPRQSDGSYLIKNVNQDIVISISGIVPDVPTGITAIDSETHIRVINGTLQITVPQMADAWITDMSGRILHSLKLTPGTTSVEGLHSGIYIVKISGQKGRKVIVK